MVLNKNILANYLGMGVIILAPILALPWYLSLLGPKLYGLLSFIATLQAFLALIDAGMSQALVREFTIHLEAKGDNDTDSAALLFGFERVYWFFSLVTGCLIALLADFIALNWLNLVDVPIHLGTQAVYGAAAIFAVQFPSSVYRSFLVGAQVHVKLNGVMICGAFIRHAGAVMILFLFPTLLAYLIWNVAIVLIETIFRARLAWLTLGINRSMSGWKIGVLRPQFRKIASMSTATLLGSLTLQIDKIILSKMISIEQFGYYVIASTVATGLLQLIFPLTQSFLPHAIQLRNQPLNLYQLNVKLFKIVTLLASIVMLVYIFFGKLLLTTWLKNIGVAESVHHYLTVLLIGTLLCAYYNIGYMNWVVYENNKLIFKINLLCVILAIVFLPISIVQFGAIGAAFSWIAFNFIGLFLSLVWIARKRFIEPN